MQPFNQLLDSAIEKLRLRKGALAWQVVDRWPDIVGEEIRKVAQPTFVRGGVLFIATSSSSWAAELSFRKQEILMRLQAAFGKDVIKEIRFSNHRWEKKLIEKPPEETPKLSSADKKEISKLSDPIHDEKLKQTFEKVLARHLTKRTP